MWRSDTSGGEWPARPGAVAVLTGLLVAVLAADLTAVVTRWRASEAAVGQLPPRSTAPSVPGLVSPDPGPPDSGPADLSVSPPSGRTGLRASARSVAIANAQVEGLATVQLEGNVGLSAEGEVIDSSGRRLGPGILTARGRRVRLEGAGLTLRSAPLVVRPGSVDLGTDLVPRASAAVVHDGDVQVSAPDLAFIAAPVGPSQPTGVSSTTTTTTAVALSAPVRLRSAYVSAIQLGGSPMRWSDAPDTLTVTGTTENGLHGTLGPMAVSWAGPGSVLLPHVPAIGGDRVGASGDNLEATIRREAGTVELAGTMHADQVYVDGVAQLETTAAVDVVDIAPMVPSGGRGWFSWTPRNTGAVAMEISSVRPGTPAGHWVNLALHALSAQVFGDKRTVAGGNTSGLGNSGRNTRNAIPIPALIEPGRGGNRGISFDVPNGTRPGNYTIALVIEGNFPPVRVEVPVTVGPPPTTDTLPA